MKQLALVDGDLAVGPKGHQTVTGPARIKQDLTLALREEYGLDRFHPRWGSLLNRYLGEILDDETRLLVQAEVNRVLQNYVIVQNAGLLSDMTYDVKGRYSTSDVVRSVMGVETQVDLDGVLLRVVLQTLSREEITLTEQVRG